MFSDINRSKLLETFKRACEGLAREKTISVENTYLVGELYGQNAQVSLNLSEKEFLHKLNLAIDDLLDRRDPIRKAERAKIRAEKKIDLSLSVPERREGGDYTAPTSPFRNERTRPTIPMTIEHAVWLRDGCRCTHTFPDQTRCEETTMLELDHVVPWSRGGEHSVENLRVICRKHNQFYAEKAFGAEFMKARVNGRTSP